MKSFVDAAEKFAGCVLLFMALLTTASAFTRYLLGKPIPDEYDVSRLCLGVVICWGMAAAFRHRDHIQLDIFWGAMNANVQRVLTRIGTVLRFVAIGFFAWALLVKIYDSFRSNVVTIELGMPIWVFYVPAWIGTLATLVVLASEIISPSDETPSLDHGI
jgi:C4-dicarboxylate transporter, DctQ subunit